MRERMIKWEKEEVRWKVNEAENVKYRYIIKFKLVKRGKMSWERVVNLNFKLGERKSVYSKFNKDVTRVGSSDIEL